MRNAQRTGDCLADVAGCVPGGHFEFSIGESLDTEQRTQGRHPACLRQARRRRPSSTCRYEDKRAPLTAFATRALDQLVTALEGAEQQARQWA